MERWLADSSGVAHRINDWLLQTYGLTVTQAVVSVNDISVERGELFLLLETAGEDTLFTSVAPPKLEVLPPSGGLFRVRFQTATNHSYQLLTSPMLPALSWTNVPAASLTGDGTIRELTAPLDANAAFFRLQITGP